MPGYVHYFYSHYSGATQAFADQKRLIMQQARSIMLHHDKKVIAQEIENKLNFFRNNTGKIFDATYTEHEVSEIEDAIQKAALNAISGLDAETVNWDTLDVTTTNQSIFSKAGVQVDRGNMIDTLGKGGQRARVNSIQPRLNALKAALSQIDTTKIDTTSLMRQLNNLQTEYNALYEGIASGQTATTQGQALGVNAAGHYGFIAGQTETYLDLNATRNRNFIDELNDLWKFTKQATNAYLKGQLGEYYGAICYYVASNLMKKSLDEIMTEVGNMFSAGDLAGLGLVGGERAGAVLLKSNMVVTGQSKNATNKNPNHFMQDQYMSNFNGNAFSMNTTQNKADLTVTLEEFGKISMSIKNIKSTNALSKPLSIHKGVSLLSLVQDYSGFLTHYLNVSAIPTDSWYNESGTRPISAAYNVMKQTVALSALTGNIWKLAKGETVAKKYGADVLVVNGPDGRYKVYFMDDILDVVAKDINSVIVKGLPESLSQTWVGDKGANSYSSAYSRINKLYTYLHSLQLEISIDKNIFNKL